MYHHANFILPVCHFRRNDSNRTLDAQHATVLDAVHDLARVLPTLDAQHTGDAIHVMEAADELADDRVEARAEPAAITSPGWKLTRRRGPARRKCVPCALLLCTTVFFATMSSGFMKYCLTTEVGRVVL